MLVRLACSEENNNISHVFTTKDITSLEFETSASLLSYALLVRKIGWIFKRDITNIIDLI